MIPCVTVFLQTDASKRGWGACTLTREGGEVQNTAGGAWSPKTRKLHINVLEAIRQGLAVLVPDIQKAHVLVETDNVTAATYLTKMGGVHSEPCRF